MTETDNPSLQPVHGSTDLVFGVGESERKPMNGFSVPKHTLLITSYNCAVKNSVQAQKRRSDLLFQGLNFESPGLMAAFSLHNGKLF